MSIVREKPFTATFPFKGNKLATITLIFKYEVSENDADAGTVFKLFECVTGTHLQELVEDFARSLYRYGRDADVEETAMEYGRSISESFANSFMTVKLQCSLPFNTPIELLHTILETFEETIGNHARAHLADPTMADLRDDIQTKAKAPGLHLICRLQGKSPREMVASSFTACRIAQGLVEELVPDMPLEFPEIIDYVTNHPESGGIQIVIGQIGGDPASPDNEGTGQYL